MGKSCSVKGDPCTRVGTESVLTISRLISLPFGLLLKRWRKGSLTVMAYWYTMNHMATMLEAGHWDVGERQMCRNVAGQTPVALLGAWDRPSALVRLWKLHIPASLCPGNSQVRHISAAGAGLSQLLSCALHTTRSPCGTQVMLNIIWNFSCHVLKDKHFCRETLPCQQPWICLGISLLAREHWPFLWTKCLASELVSHCSQSWHYFVGFWCF